MDMLDKKNIEKYDQYFRNDDYLVWEMIGGEYKLVRIVDMQLGSPEFKVESQINTGEKYYLSKTNQFECTRFKVIEMFQ